MTRKKPTKLQLAQEASESAISKINKKIVELGNNTSSLYDSLTSLQDVFDQIRGIPSETKLQYEELKRIRLNWRHQAEVIEKRFREATGKNAGAFAAGAGVGVAVAAMGPSVAMGVATTFGVASTGTAISTLSGAAATNAALAWLGGGAVAAGGGGIVAGKFVLFMCGPVGISIAIVSLLTSGILIWKNATDKKHIEEVFISICERDEKAYDLSVVELNERITRIVDESSKLSCAIEKIKTFGLDYDSMTEQQKYELGSYVNLMNASTQLLVNPIMGLQPRYNQADFDDYISWIDRKADMIQCMDRRDLIISLANLLYKIELNDRDKKLLWKSMRENKEMLKSMDITKQDFDISILDAVCEALEYKYSNG